MFLLLNYFYAKYVKNDNLNTKMQYVIARDVDSIANIVN